MASNGPIDPQKWEFAPPAESYAGEAPSFAGMINVVDREYAWISFENLLKMYLKLQYYQFILHVHCCSTHTLNSFCCSLFNNTYFSDLITHHCYLFWISKKQYDNNNHPLRNQIYAILSWFILYYTPIIAHSAHHHVYIKPFTDYHQLSFSKISYYLIPQDMIRALVIWWLNMSSLTNRNWRYVVIAQICTSNTFI